MRIRSFDVFDTVLTRSYAVPSDLFVDLGEQLVDAGVFNGTAGQFAQVRWESEEAARRTEPSGEIVLDEIYAVMRERLGWRQEQVAASKARELQLEAQSLLGVPEATAMIAEARHEAGLVWFISDMYLPGTFVESLLRREGFFCDGDRLLLSGEHRSSKHAGGLFEKVRSLARGPVESWIHVGDNLHADVKMPTRHGISSRWFPEPRLNLREQELRGRDRFVPGWRSRTAAACRVTRLTGSPGLGAEKRSIWTSSSDVAGPLVFAYVWWCLAKAMEMGLRRLYFVARDGQILHRVAQVLVREWNLPIRPLYLYGSRQAWHLAGLTSLADEGLEGWLFQGAKELTLKRLLQRLGLSPAELGPGLEACGFPRHSWDDPLVPGKLEQVKDWLAQPEICNRVLAVAAGRRALLGEYLERAGVFDDDQWGVVDIGWHGNMQKSLSNALRALGKSTAFAGFYFGLLRRVTSIEGQPVRSMWNELFGCTFPVELTYMSELFMAADHGSVVGYRRAENGEVVPVLNRPVNEMAVAWGLSVHQAAVVDLAGRLGKLLRDQRDILDDFCRATCEQFESAYRNPTQDEAGCWGRLPFSTDQAESDFRCLIPASSCFQRLLYAWIPRWRPEAWWIEGANKIHPCLPVSLYLACRALKRRMT